MEPGKLSIIFKWAPLTPSDVLLLLAVLVALFGERLWRMVDNSCKRAQLKLAVVQLLKNLRKNVIRIRDKRNQSETGDVDQNKKVLFSSTSAGEISHYFPLMESLVLSNLDILKLPSESKTIDLLDHYRMNIEVLERRTEKHLTLGTVNKLIERVDSAISELSL